MKRTATLLILAILPVASAAQAPVRIAEGFTPGYQYQVSCRVEIKGTLNLPPQKDAKGPTTLSLTGSSAMDYLERLLPPLKDGKGERTLRIVRKMDFQRKVGEQVQEISLRPEVKRLVILRSQQLEVPFSPDGPLLWNETDL